MDKKISAKMGIKESSRAYFQNVPEDFCKIIECPLLNISEDLNGRFDYIHIFVIYKVELEESLKKLESYLSEHGHLWISWPKSGQIDTDLNLPKVIEVVYKNGLVESKTVSINSIWSAIKITKPIKGKVYKNSYGVLNPGN